MSKKNRDKEQIAFGRTVDKCLITRNNDRSETVFAPSLQIAPLYRPKKLAQFGDLAQFRGKILT